ncbi:MAG: type I polyketide synthase [Vicinamibacterales bacterium]
MSGTADLSPVKRALLEIRELKARVAASTEPIAVVGAGLRLPGGISNLDALWAFLLRGGDAIGDVPADRWDADAFFDADPDAPGRMSVRRGGFLDDVYRFDAAFFGIAPLEADSMDPQQRVALETAWHACEDAGVAPTSLAGSRTGVFMGVSNNDYGRMVFEHRDRITPYFASGNAASVVAGRISYLLGLMGPSLSVDTACSSSLTAVHLAVQSLRARDCDLALAGGVSLILAPEVHITFTKARMLSPDGRCKTFDADADGYVRSEGAAIVVLKRLSDCTPADRVLGLIRGSAINQDGRSGGLTAPNGLAQAAVIRSALQAAGVDGSDVAYVEAHGTGTPLGDPIEVLALADALGGRAGAAPLAVGSAKTNFGHLEAAAGILGLLKAVLVAQRGVVPPHLHYRSPNPHIPWAQLPLHVPVTATPLVPRGAKRLAGVSAFGFSGTNAHVVVEGVDAPARSRPASAVPHVLTITARTPSALDALAHAYDRALGAGDASAADVCFTANVGRAQLAHRVSVRGSDARGLRDALQARAGTPQALAAVRGHAAGTPKVAFLFTGGGAQSPGMARRLYDDAPVFREAFDRAAAILDPMLGVSLRDTIDTAGDAEAPVHVPRLGQPALVAVELALVALWTSWGITPVAVAGHSLGEYAAACAAGILPMDEALRLVVLRTSLLDRQQVRGAMATLFLDATAVAPLLRPFDGRVVIGAHNGPEQVVISGDADGVQQIVQQCEARGVRVSRLRVPYASHSPLVDPMLDAFEAALAPIRVTDASATLVSTLTGQVEDAAALGQPAYWRAHLRQPVRFADAVQTLAGLGITHVLEIGPHPVLTAMGAACLPDGPVWLPSLQRERDDWDVMLESLQVLHAGGAAVDWRAVGDPHGGVCTALPLYPFEGRAFGAGWADRAVAHDTSVSEWTTVTAALDRQSNQAPLSVDVTGYAARWDALAVLARAEIVATLRAAGVFGQAGERASVEDVRRRLSATEHHTRLLGRWLARLASDGLLERDGSAFVMHTPLPDPDRAGAWRDAERLLAGNAPLLAHAALRPPAARGAARRDQPAGDLVPRRRVRPRRRPVSPLRHHAVRQRARRVGRRGVCREPAGPGTARAGAGRGNGWDERSPARQPAGGDRVSLHRRLGVLHRGGPRAFRPASGPDVRDRGSGSRSPCAGPRRARVRSRHRGQRGACMPRRARGHRAAFGCGGGRRPPAARRDDRRSGVVRHHDRAHRGMAALR